VYSEGMGLTQWWTSDKSRIKIIAPLIALLLVLLVAVVLISASGAERVRQERAAQIERQFNSPNVAVKRQVKRVLIKKVTPEGVRYYEIFLHGQINEYDENMNLLRSSLQGFSRVGSLFDEIDRNLDDWLNNNGGSGSIVEVDTNQGNHTFPPNNPSGTPGPSPTGGGGGGVDDIIDDIIDDTFSPTPTTAPSPTPMPGQPTNTPAPSPTLRPTVRPTVNPNASPTPTGLPQYMLNPPFNCDDYDITKPTTISNVICVPD
jgi:hypothetical protein